MSIVDTGACPAMMLTAPACAADVVACAGRHMQPNTIIGTLTSAAAGDGSGAVALGCVDVESGSPPQFNYYLPARNGYAKSAQLGEQVWMLDSGAIGLSVAFHLAPNPTYDFFASDGVHLRSIAQGTSMLFAAGNVIELVTSTTQTGGWSVRAQKLDAQGSAAGAALKLTDIPQSSTGGALVILGAVDLHGHTLVVVGQFGTADPPLARWLAPDGNAETPIFALQGVIKDISSIAAMPGGGVAVGGDPLWSGVGWRPWTMIAAGSTVESPVPEWLSSRGGEFRLVHGGKAAAFVRGDHAIVASDGAVCGSIHFASGSNLWTGPDGTVVDTRSDTTFRVYPQLLR
jgi:hypothetical protein